MEQKGKGANRDRVIAGGCILLFTGAFGFAVVQKNASGDLRAQLEEERLRNIQLADKSTQLQKDLLSRDMRLVAMTDEQAELRAQMMKEKQRAEEALRKAELAAASRPRTDGSRKEIDQLKADLLRAEQALAAANSRVGDLTADNTRLRGVNDKLSSEMAQASETAATVNNSLVQATRGNKKEKLVVKARRTQHLGLDLELPADLASNTRLKVTGPDGKSFEIIDPVVTASTYQPAGEATASTGGGAGASRKMSRVSMKHCLKEKLAPGTYRIDVYSGKKYLGTTRTALR